MKYRLSSSRSFLLTFWYLILALAVAIMPYLLWCFLSASRSIFDLLFVSFPFFIGAASIVILLIKYLYTDWHVCLEESEAVTTIRAGGQLFRLEDFERLEVFYSLDFAKALFSSFKYYRLVSEQDKVGLSCSFLIISEKKIVGIAKKHSLEIRYMAKQFPLMTSTDDVSYPND